MLDVYKARERMAIFKMVAPQDGGWSLTPMENLLRGLRNGNEFVSLELYGAEGVVGYTVRAHNGNNVGGVLRSYFPQAEVERRSDERDDELDSDDWLHLSEDEFAMIQPLSLEREAYLPLRIFDDRVIEQSKIDPLAGVIGVLASSTRSEGETVGERLGMRLVIRPAEENWNSPWQDRMQKRRDGEDRTVVPRGTGNASASAPGLGTIGAWGGLGALALGNWWFWDQGNMAGLVLFDMIAAVLGMAGISFIRKYGGGKRRPYLDEELVEAKLKALAFWTELQIVRIYPKMGDVTEARESMGMLLDCLRSFDDPAGNSWREGKVYEFDGQKVRNQNGMPRLAKHPFLGGTQVLEWLEPRRARRTALSAREVASLWHPPLGVDEMASMERTAAGNLAPFLADLNVGGEDAGPLVGLAGQEGQKIRLPESSIRKHAFILGRSGVGKTTMMKHVLAHKLARKAQGRDEGAIVVIDPHADLVRDTLKMVPPEIADKVRLLDFGRMDRVPGINLVDPYLFTDRDRCVDTIIGTVKHLWEHWGGRLEDLLKRSLSIVYEFNAHPDTARSEMLTMLDILALLDEGKQVGSGRDTTTEESEFQTHVLSRVTDLRLKEWFKAYLNWPRDTRAEAVGPVHSRIGAYAADARASVIMGQRESTIMLSDVLSEGLVLLVSTAQGSIGVQPAALMGGTMVSLVDSALREQENVPQEERAKCLLVCDEFQTVTGANWEGMLAESRKYGCSLMLATQSLARLDTPERKLKAGVLANVGCIVGYQMSAEDARIISAEMDAERVQERFLVNLHPHHCYVRISSDKKTYPAFSMKTLPPPDASLGSERSERAVLEASEAYTTDWAEARLRMNAELEERFRLEKFGAVKSGPAKEREEADGVPGDGPGSAFVQALGESRNARREEGALIGMRERVIENSALAPELIETLRALPSDDGAIKYLFGERRNRMEKDIRSEVVKEEREKITEEVRESMKKDILRDEKEMEAEARKELALAQVAERGEGRDVKLVRRVET